MNIIRRFLSWYFRKESLPYWCLFLIDSVAVFLSGLIVYWLVHRTGILFNHRLEVWYSLLFYTAISWVGAKAFNTYAGVVRCSSFVDLLNVAYANGLSIAIAIPLSFIFESKGIETFSAFSQMEIFFMYILATILMAGTRVVVKTLHDLTLSDEHALRVLIYGAMSGGVEIAKSIRSHKPQRFILRGFISHDNRAHHMSLMGHKVYNVDEDFAPIIYKERIQAVLVSPYRIDDFRNNQEIQDVFIKAGCKIFMTHEASEASIKDGVISDRVKDVMQLKEVSVEDLLPRSEITVDLKSVEEMLAGRRVLITGAAGSIGSEIVRQVAEFKPEKLMLIDQAETPSHDLELMMHKDFPNVSCDVVVTSISRRTRMEYIFDSFRPEYVFHAAAYKHVPMMEKNPSEAVMNNVYGTKVIADLSVKYDVKKFVMISTDKAVNPTNVMGCSKRICEIYVQSLNQKLKEDAQADIAGPEYTQFVTTRFGNVLGSNGSVIPLFREQIKNGGPVTVTDARIVRYFMLIPEACKLVLEAGTKGNGGEIFVFDMGKPVKIIDLANRMIALSGAKNVEVIITGLRPGEKLYEEVLNKLEGTKPSFHDRIRIAEVRQYDFKKVCQSIDELIAVAKSYDNMSIVKRMKEIVPEYKSNNSEYEKLD